MKHFRGEKRFYYGMSVLVLVFIIAGLTSNLEGGVRGNRQEKEAFDQKPEEVQTEQENQEEVEDSYLNLVNAIQSLQKK